MADRSKALPTTDEEWPKSEEGGDAGRPVLLVAFPRPIAILIPKTGEILGRAWLEGIGIPDSKVSREHLRLSRPGGNLRVEDVGSRHGTFVDGYKLEPQSPVALDDGAILRVGQTVMVYREAFEGPLDPQPPLDDLVGPWGLSEVRKRLLLLRREPLNILIEGATGTGKELLARHIARVLGRDRRYVPINIASLPRDIFDGHLFGWEKGAFTGGAQSSPGVLRGAAGGAVFIDEVEALPLELQPKLLRFLQQREVFPIGAREPTRVDVAIIAATNRPVSDLLEKDAFRRDLLARFLYRFQLPPLADRPEDMFAIFAALWGHYHGPLDLLQTRVDAEAVERMMRHDWPENVRGLQRLFTGIDPAVGLKLSLVQRELGGERDSGAPRKAPPLTREVVQSMVDACGGNQSEAARRLKISRPQLLRWLKKQG
jgi:transcriptional regulator with PAS, ATPase and Fis domain